MNNTNNINGNVAKDEEHAMPIDFRIAHEGLLFDVAITATGAAAAGGQQQPTDSKCASSQPANSLAPSLATTPTAAMGGVNSSSRVHAATLGERQSLLTSSNNTNSNNSKSRHDYSSNNNSYGNFHSLDGPAAVPDGVSVRTRVFTIGTVMALLVSIALLMFGYLQPAAPAVELDVCDILCRGPVLATLQRNARILFARTDSNSSTNSNTNSNTNNTLPAADTADNKLIVDMPLLFDPAVVWRDFFSLPDLSQQQLQQFVRRNFAREGSDIEPWTPPDWQPQPHTLSSIAINNDSSNSDTQQQMHSFAMSLHQLWPTLGRQLSSDVYNHSNRHTLMPLKEPFMIVPGGRFREIYYWDNYWIIRGLLVSSMRSTAFVIVNNLLDLVRSNSAGDFVPNGNRVYYLNRSQPPLLTAMVWCVFNNNSCENTNHESNIIISAIRNSYSSSSNSSGQATFGVYDINWLRESVLLLDREYTWWMTLGQHAVEVNFTTPTTQAAAASTRQFVMNRYFSDSAIARPESWLADTTTAQQLLLIKAQNNKQQQQSVNNHTTSSIAASGKPALLTTSDSKTLLFNASCVSYTPQQASDCYNSDHNNDDSGSNHDTNVGSDSIIHSDNLQRAEAERLLQENDKDVRNLMSQLTATAESGWDFASRWFSDGANLTTAITTQILPTDLNTIMCMNERLLYQMHSIIRDNLRQQQQQYKLNSDSKIANSEDGRRQQQLQTQIDNENAAINKYQQAYNDRLIAVDALLYNHEHHHWQDYNIVTGNRSSSSSSVLSNFLPLWTKCYRTREATDVLISAEAVSNFSVAADSVDADSESNATATVAKQSAAGTESDNAQAQLQQQQQQQQQQQLLLSSTATLTPLVNETKVLMRLLNSGLLLEGGAVTSLSYVGQQWDYPNAWAPLQHMLITGVEHSDLRVCSDTLDSADDDDVVDDDKMLDTAIVEAQHINSHSRSSSSNDDFAAATSPQQRCTVLPSPLGHILARSLAHTWLYSNFLSFNNSYKSNDNTIISSSSTRHQSSNRSSTDVKNTNDSTDNSAALFFMYEKYYAPVAGVGSGGGGEYRPQTGFGWSNGVALLLLQKYGDTADVVAWQQMRNSDGYTYHPLSAADQLLYRSKHRHAQHQVSTPNVWQPVSLP